MKTMFSATLMAVVWGLSSGLSQVSLAYSMPYFYGTKCIATLNSMFATAMVLGSAVGPIAYGVAIDKVGSWAVILWWTAPIAMLSSILLLLFAQKPVHPNPERVQAGQPNEA